MSLPPTLETLWLPEDSDQPLDSVTWPSGLTTFGLFFDFSLYRHLQNITWPSSLQDLFMVNEPDEMIDYPRGRNVNRMDYIGERLFSVCCIDRCVRGQDPNVESA